MHSVRDALFVARLCEAAHRLDPNQGPTGRGPLSRGEVQVMALGRC